MSFNARSIWIVKLDKTSKIQQFIRWDTRNILDVSLTFSYARILTTMRFVITFDPLITTVQHLGLN